MENSDKCRKCKYLDWNKGFFATAKCKKAEPVKESYKDVLGKKHSAIYPMAHNVRSDESLCGSNAVWFEPKYSKIKKIQHELSSNN